MQVPGHSSLGSGASVVGGGVGAGVVGGLGGGGGAKVSCLRGGGGGAGLEVRSNSPLPATMDKIGIRELAVFWSPVIPVSNSGPNVLIRDDMSGPGLLGLCTGGGLGGGILGGGVALPGPGSL